MSLYIKIGNLNIKSKVMATAMAGISDLVYRNILRQFNTNSILSTEMISSEALQQRKIHKIIYKSDTDSPIIYQISGHKPDIMLKAALKITDLADIIDINMGCPIPKIVKIGDGSALMKTPEIASKIVKTLSDNLDKPVSVKMRLGWDNKSINYLDFAKLMEDSGASMIVLHARTRAQMYSGEVSWEHFKQIKQAIKIPVFANGDIIDPIKAKECLDYSGCDGIAIGRGLLGNPWLLNRVDKYIRSGELLPPPSLINKLEMSLQHCSMLREYLGEKHGLKHSRKFFAWYIKGGPLAAKYRAKLMILESFEEVQMLIEEIKTRTLSLNK